METYKEDKLRLAFSEAAERFKTQHQLHDSILVLSRIAKLNWYWINKKEPQEQFQIRRSKGKLEMKQLMIGTPITFARDATQLQLKIAKLSQIQLLQFSRQNQQNDCTQQCTTA